MYLISFTPAATTNFRQARQGNKVVYKIAPSGETPCLAA